MVTCKKGCFNLIVQKCTFNFIERERRTKKIAAKKVMCVHLNLLGKISFNILAKIFNICPSLTYCWIIEVGAKLLEYNIYSEIKEMEFGKRWYFIGLKKLWVIKAFDRDAQRTVAWVLGNRDVKIFKRLYQKSTT